MDQFSDRLARLSDLSDDDLSSLEAQMIEAFDAADTSGDLDTMQAVADALDGVRAEASSRADQAPAAPAPADLAPAAPAAAPAPDAQAAAVVTAAAEDDDPAVEEVPEPSEEADPEPAPEAEPEPETEPEVSVVDPEPAPVAADEALAAEAEAEPEPEPESEPAPETESEDPVATEITADEVPEEHEPDLVSASAVPNYVIRAGGDIPGFTSGTTLEDMDVVAEAMAAKINSMRGIGGDGEHIIVASMRTTLEADETRTLYRGDAVGNGKKIRSLLSDKEQLTPEGLTAGAWCAPRAPIYDVPTVGTTARPVRDSLPTFNANRGGVVWMEPPVLPTIDDSLALWRYSGSAWQSFTDTPGTGTAGTTKPCFTIPCGTEHTADLDALTLCMCFDNLMAKAFPEWVRATTDLTMVAQARFAEQVALSQMFAIATTGTCGTPATQVGAARDFLLTVRAAAASLRWSLRMDMNAPLQLLAPSWVAEAMAIDLALQSPGDSTYRTTDSEVMSAFSDFHVQPVWYIDDAPGTDAFSGCSFPANAHWLLYPTGSFIRLDNGELNLGIVRTKEDVQANRYCEFSETFETIAYMGPASHAWVTRGLTQIDLAGSSGAPRAITIS